MGNLEEESKHAINYDDEEESEGFDEMMVGEERMRNGEEVDECGLEATEVLDPKLAEGIKDTEAT